MDRRGQRPPGAGLDIVTPYPDFVIVTKSEFILRLGEPLSGRLLEPEGRLSDIPDSPAATQIAEGQLALNCRVSFDRKRPQFFESVHLRQQLSLVGLRGILFVDSSFKHHGLLYQNKWQNNHVPRLTGTLGLILPSAIRCFGASRSDEHDRRTHQSSQEAGQPRASIAGFHHQYDTTKTATAFIDNTDGGYPLETMRPDKKDVMRPLLPALLCLAALVAAEEKPNLPLVDLSGQKERPVVLAAGTPTLYQGHPTTLLKR